MKVKEESEKAGLKPTFTKLRSWHLCHHFKANRREKMEIVADFIFLGSKITADSDCHNEIKRCLFFGRNDAKAETPVLWPPHSRSWLSGKDWCWEGFGAGGEGDDRGWDGWMTSLTQWMWVWVSSRELTGLEDKASLMDREAWSAAIHGSQRVGHDWATELNWTELRSS